MQVYLLVVWVVQVQARKKNNMILCWDMLGPSISQRCSLKKTVTGELRPKKQHDNKYNGTQRNSKGNVYNGNLRAPVSRK